MSTNFSFHVSGFVISLIIYLIIIGLSDLDFHYVAMINPLQLLNLGIYSISALAIWFLSKVIHIHLAVFASFPAFAVFIFWTGGIAIYSNTSAQNLSEFNLMALPYGITVLFCSAQF